MTDEEWIDLGRRAVACRAWRWRRGMSTICGLVAQSNEDANGRVHFGQWVEPHPDWIPDLRDPATVGCLLALVREAWGGKIGGADRYKVPDGDPGLWGIHVWTADSSVARRFTAPTEAAALVAALKSAPEPTR